MSFFVVLFVILPLVLIFYLVIKYQRTIMAFYWLRQQHKEAKMRQEAEADRQERVRKRTHPEQTSVEMIQDASIDLEGGEYIDYEEVSDR